MARRGVDGLRHARGGAIAPAIIGRAKMGPTLHDLARYVHARHLRIETILARAPTRVVCAAAAGRDRPVTRLVPVRGPLPDIADHVVEAVAVGWKGPHRRRAMVAVTTEILPREFALPGVRHQLSVRLQIVAPGIFSAVEAAARGEFP